MNLPLAARRVANGEKILVEWLGEGGNPVEPELANERAKTCEPCQENSQSKSWLAKLIAGKILAHLRVKHELGLKVENEDKIGTCEKCGCHLPLKVWTPLKHISANTPMDELSALPDHCWVRKEML